jgi:hypothetical protein
MGLPSLVRPASFACLVAGALAASTACHTCGLGQHDRVLVGESPVPCCGGFVFKDLALMGRTSGAEFELVNTAKPTQPGSVDAYLVPTSCGKLFEGDYPGSAPLCSIYAGPARPGGVSARAKLAPGTYRVFLQGYSANTQTAGYLVDVMVWDYSCGPSIQ